MRLTAWNRALWLGLGNLLCLSLGLLAGCGKPGFDLQDSEPLEVVTDLRKFPQVVLVVLPNGRGICTGTFISPRTVLTAAHCTQWAGTYQAVSGFGTFSTNQFEALGPGQVEDPNDMALLIFGSDMAKRSLGQVVPVGTQVQLMERIRLVGFGCTDIDKKRGAGIKRTGLNQVASLDDYIGLLSPMKTIESTGARGILGTYNRAGSCFGDSGGPMFRMAGNELSIVGISHAGGKSDEAIHSMYVDINRGDNLDFLETMDQRYSLGIFDVCDPTDMLSGSACDSQPASFQLLAFLKFLWLKVLTLVRYML